MRGYFADDLLLIMPTAGAAGVRLFGEVISAHRGPLTIALTDQRRDTEQAITVDFTEVHYVANSALETLVALAHSLSPPQHLLALAPPRLGLRERLSAHGWDEIEALRLVDA